MCFALLLVRPVLSNERLVPNTPTKDDFELHHRPHVSGIYMLKVHVHETRFLPNDGHNPALLCKFLVLRLKPDKII